MAEQHEQGPLDAAEAKKIFGIFEENDRQLYQRMSFERLLGIAELVFGVKESLPEFIRLALEYNNSEDGALYCDPMIEALTSFKNIVTIPSEDRVRGNTVADMIYDLKNNDNDCPLFSYIKKLDSFIDRLLNVENLGVKHILTHQCNFELVIEYLFGILCEDTEEKREPRGKKRPEDRSVPKELKEKSPPLYYIYKMKLLRLLR